MIKERVPRPLDRLLMRLLFVRLLLPLLLVALLAMTGVLSLSGRALVNRQRHTVHNMARTVERYLDHAGRMLNAVVRAVDLSSPEKTEIFLHGTREAYDYFDTLYHLNPEGRIALLSPPDPRYAGLDMSSLPQLRQSENESGLAISTPFISLRTGKPTVYLIRRLADGGRIVGELSLGALQEEIAQSGDISWHGAVFILDQSGTLLAHPSFDLVAQQTNLSSLRIFRRGLVESATLVYEYGGEYVLGSSSSVEQAGWVVVNQTPLLAVFRPYAWVTGAAFLLSLLVFAVPVFALRRELRQNVVLPLRRLGEGTAALAKGNFESGKALASIPSAFSELRMLAADFEHMSGALQAREAELCESEERYRTLFERVPIPLFRSAPEGTQLDVNAAFVRMMGFPDRERLLSVNTKEFYVNREDREGWRAIADREGTVHDFEMMLRRYDDSFIQVRLTGRAARNSDGSLIAYEGSIEDITERKRAEQIIAAKNKELEQIVYAASHDFRSPLVNIDGYSREAEEWLAETHEVLYKEGISLEEVRASFLKELPDILAAFCYIRSSVRQMDSLLKGLLALSRSGRAALHIESLEMNELLASVVSSFSFQIREAGADVHVGDLPRCRGDDIQTTQVFANLLGNALKFLESSRPGKVSITGELHEGRAVYCVEDNGIGIAPEHRERIFGLFYRLNPSESDGEGLGLTIVRRILERMDGEIRIESEPGRGSRFFVILPAAALSAAEDER